MNAEVNELPPARADAEPGLRATYRLQLSPAFTFAAATQVVPYLARLGVSHLYLSPVFQARRGSVHGYDVIDHARINAELGGEAAFRTLAHTAHAHGLGVIVDVVPNHMAVMTAENPHWLDVLENGPAAESAAFFDIDWRPNRLSMRDRLLVPVLAAPFGEILEQGLIRVAFAPATGAFHLEYEDQRLPLDPSTYPVVLELAAQAANASDLLDPSTRDDLENLSADFARLPPTNPPAGEAKLRYRDKEAGKRRLARLCERSPAVAACIETAMTALNGEPGHAASFDRLAMLLDRQPYRLAYWRVAGEEINYRRFFDVDSLAAVRVEEDLVFDALHRNLQQLLAEGIVDGVRVDHADGLRDPPAYLSRLAALAPPRRPYIVIEKILGPEEALQENWPVAGTTGYEFAATVGNWLLYRRGMSALDRAFRTFTGSRRNYEDVEYESKQLIMRTSLAAEVTMLAIRLDRLAQAHRRYVDLTFFSLREALVEALAAFPVYRTYGSPAMDAEERRIVARAIGIAIGRGRADREALQYLKDILLKDASAVAPGNTAAVAEFVARFQQVSAPVMAKSTEDTAFYRYPRLIALNEVGSSPRANGITTARLHAANRKRYASWPHSMLATATHDTKLGEDVRCRLYVLAELAAEWAQLTSRWQRLRGRPGRDTPHRILEYLLLQALLGSWPAMESADHDARRRYRERIAEYALKAAREAKQFTSWLQQDAEQEAGIATLVDSLLPQGGATGFDAYFASLLQPVAGFGMLNSLSMLVLKLTASGVPDIYQGTELPQFVFVDPDNRQPVDFAARAALLDRLESASGAYDPKTTATRLLREWWSGEIKTFVLWRLLTVRRQLPAAFAGRYIPLKAQGPHADHLCAYLRRAANATDGVCLVVVSRWLATLSGRRFPLPPGAELWANTAIELAPSVPRGRYTDVFTGVDVDVHEGSAMLLASSLLAVLPVAVLRFSSPERSS